MTRVFVVARVRLYREGLADLLARAGFEIVGTGVEAGSCGTDLLATRPDLVLLDVIGADDVAAIRRVVNVMPHAAIVAFGLSGSSSDVLACAEAGARGYVTDNESADELVAVLNGVARDEVRCSPRIAAALMKRVAALATNGPVEPDVRLTRRELEIASLVEKGLSNKEIAERLVIEVTTVKSHVHSILGKLKATRRADAAAWMRGREIRQSRL